MADSRSLVNRMVRAAKLQVDLYEEVEADTTANGQTFLAVIIASLAWGIGAGISGLLVKGGLWFLWGLLMGLTAAIVGWLAWSLLAYWLGYLYRLHIMAPHDNPLLRYPGIHEDVLISAPQIPDVDTDGKRLSKVH
jgi:hypothetical protein